MQQLEYALISYELPEAQQAVDRSAFPQYKSLEGRDFVFLRNIFMITNIISIHGRKMEEQSRK